MNTDNNIEERYAWVDQRLEQLYLDDRNHYQEDSLLDEDDSISEDGDQPDIIHLNAYDQREGDDDFRVICRRLFPNDEDSEATEADILSETSECNQGEVLPAQVFSLQLPEGPPLMRANTQFQLNGVTVYNGNPNGSRFFDEPDDLEPIM